MSQVHGRVSNLIHPHLIKRVNGFVKSMCSESTLMVHYSVDITEYTTMKTHDIFF